MIEKFRQSRNYRILDEILSAMTHGFGVALSIAGLVLIILRGVEVGGAMRITAFSIYGSDEPPRRAGKQKKTQRARPGRPESGTRHL